jgi:hypothetical protein
MPSTSATLTVPAPVATVYRYLHERYDRPAHRDVSLACKGYVPPVTRLVAERPHRLSFSVQARDSLLPIFYGGWRWEYDLWPVGDSATQVRISYRWGWVMAFLGMGMIHHQACNEIVETAMALDALGWSQDPASVPEPAQEGPSSEAIRLPPGG